MRASLKITSVICCILFLIAGCSKKYPEQGSSGSSKVLILNNKNFETQIADGIVLVDFWAVWCGPCRIQGPIVDKVAEQVEGNVKVAKLDVDKNSSIAGKFNVRQIPTIIIFKDGKDVLRFVGVTDAAKLLDSINSLKQSQTAQVPD